MQLVDFFRSRRGGELVGIVIMAIGISLAAALLTYHPRDSSAFYTSTETEIRNAIGYYGATLAWVFVGFFGFASLLFPAVMLVGGWNRFWGRDIEYFHTKLIGFVVLALAIPPLFDLTLGKVWLREALIASGGYLGQEINRAISGNMNTSGAAIALVTALLIGLLLATRISLALVFLAIHQWFVALGRAISLQWARFSERRRKEKAKVALVRKHLEKTDAPQLRLVPSSNSNPAASSDAGVRGPIVREVNGRGSFQIRKVTKADLRKAAEALSQQDAHDPFELYTAPSTSRPARVIPNEEPVVAPPKRVPKPVPVLEPEEDFEDPLFEDLPIPARAEAADPASADAQAEGRDAPRDQADARLSAAREPAHRGAEAGHHQRRGPQKFLEIGHLIEARCAEFSVEGEVTAYHPGPVVTTFEFKPSAGVKYAKVVNLGDDLALALKAESIRIERISGSSTVGIEVPNKKRELITLRDIIETESFSASSSLLSLALGKDIHGEAVVTDLARMPHLLVAGATGAGKSVGLNSMIVSLLYKALPKQLRMLMIDPKMVELKVYEDIPHLAPSDRHRPEARLQRADLGRQRDGEPLPHALPSAACATSISTTRCIKDAEGYRRALKLSPDAPLPACRPDAVHRHHHRRVRRPDDGRLEGRRGFGDAAGAESARGRHPSHHRHAAARRSTSSPA